MQAVGLLVGILLVVVFPALCIGRIADQLGRNGVRFALLLIPSLAECAASAGLLRRDPAQIQRHPTKRRNRWEG